jgi:hypothetical protein
MAPKSDSLSAHRAAGVRKAAWARAGQAGHQTLNAPPSAEAMRRAGPGPQLAAPLPRSGLGSSTLFFCAAAPLIFTPFAWIVSPQPAALALAWICAAAFFIGSASARAHWVAHQLCARTRLAFPLAAQRAIDAGDERSLQALRAIRAAWSRHSFDDSGFCRKADALAPSPSVAALPQTLDAWAARLILLDQTRKARSQQAAQRAKHQRP